MSTNRLINALVGVITIALCASCVPKEDAEGVDDGGKKSCLAERNIVENAVEAYYALNRKNPTSEAELVPMYLRTQSVTMDVDATGNVVAAPGSGCI